MFVMWDPTAMGRVAKIVERAGPAVSCARKNDSAHVDPTAGLRRESVASLVGKHARVNQDFFEVFGNFCMVPSINRRSSTPSEKKIFFFRRGGCSRIVGLHSLRMRC